MASPQREDGYTALANEILEQMAKIKLSPTQYRLLFVVWRYTYGFQRKEAELSLTFLAEATGCDKRQLQRELKGLMARRILYQIITESPSRVIGFIKNYDLWLHEIPVGEIAIGETDNGKTTNGESVEGSVGETDNPPIGETDNQERKILKKNIKKDIYAVFNHWNSKKIVVHRELSDKLAGHINARLEKYTAEDLKTAIDNYDTVLKGKEYWWTHQWTLGEFLTRDNGLVKFLSENKPLENFLNKEVKPNGREPKGDILAYKQNSVFQSARKANMQ